MFQSRHFDTTKKKKKRNRKTLDQRNFLESETKTFAIRLSEFKNYPEDRDQRETHLNKMHNKSNGIEKSEIFTK